MQVSSQEGHPVREEDAGIGVLSVSYQLGVLETQPFNYQLLIFTARYWDPRALS